MMDNSQETRIAILENAYANMEKRMDKIEDKLDEMQEDFKNSNNQMVKVVIASAGTVIGAVLSTLVIVINSQI